MSEGNYLVEVIWTRSRTLETHHCDCVVQGVRLNEYIDKGTLHCSCGPEDNRNLLNTARHASSDGDSDKPGTFSRMDRTALGCSVRVGCPVRFAFRRQPGTEVIVEIQYYDRQHVNHGTEAQV